MNDRSFDALTRRASLMTLGVAGLAALTGSFTADGKKKKTRKHRGHSNKTLCLSNGSQCKKKSKKCKANNCLATPFTIEARWSNPASDHDTYLFVPNDLGDSLPAPYIDCSCHSDRSDGTHYPFAFVSQDASGPGDEVTTIAFLLDGTYEYWIKLEESIPAGDLTVTLRSVSGRVLRSWSSPQNASANDRGWHVFTIQGRTKSITAIDNVIDGYPIIGGHDPYTDVCP